MGCVGRLCGPLPLLSPVTTLLVVLLAALPYVNTLHGGIVYDDKVAVAGNPDVTMHNLPLSELFLHDFWGNRMKITLPEWLGANITLLDSPWTHNSYRPLTVLTIRLNHWLGGLDTFVYHATNIGIHVLTCVLAAYVLVTLVGRGRRMQAGVAAVLFACHPTHTEVVANITSRAETLSAVFMLAAIAVYFHITNPRVRGCEPGVCSSITATLLSFLLVILATLCKETALVIPIMIAALDLVCNTPEFPRMRGKGRDSACGNFWAYIAHVFTKGHVLRAVVLVLLQVFLLYVRVTILSSGYTLHTSTMHNPIQAMEDPLFRRLSFAYVQSLAMSMLVLPIYLSHEHNALTPITSLTDPRILLIPCLWGTIFALFRAAFKRSSGGDKVSDIALLGVPVGGREEYSANRLTRILSGLLLTLVPYIPASHLFVFVAFVLAERSLFMPSLGACLLMSEALMWACSLYKAPPPSPPPPEPVPPPPALPVPPPATLPPVPGSEPEVMAPTSPPAPTEGLRQRKHTQAAPSAPPAAPVRPAPAPASNATRYRLLVSLVSLLCCYYVARTVTRNLDWLSEEALLTSNLNLYPERNPMSTYGLGARAMYDGNLTRAVDFLSRSLTAAGPNVTFAEPYILLAQIHWGYEFGAPEHITLAKQYLQKMVDAHSAKREFWSNLGLLMFATERDNPVALNQSEYYVLAAAVGHALGPNDPMLGQLYVNAGCIRLLSDPERYGNPELAEQEFRKATLSQSPHAVRSGYGNLAVLYAIHGLFDHAVQALESAWESGQAALLAREQHAQADVERFGEFAGSLGQNEALIRQWSQEGGLVVGKRAQDRMGVLRANCKTILLWL